MHGRILNIERNERPCIAPCVGSTSYKEEHGPEMFSARISTTSTLYASDLMPAQRSVVPSVRANSAQYSVAKPKHPLLEKRWSRSRSCSSGWVLLASVLSTHCTCQQQQHRGHEASACDYSSIALCLHTCPICLKDAQPLSDAVLHPSFACGPTMLSC